MKNNTDFTARPDLTSEARLLIEQAQSEGNTELLALLHSAKASLPTAQEIANTRAPIDPIEP